MGRALGTPMKTLTGQLLYGVFKKATDAREHYDTEFLTRRMLVIDGDQNVAPGSILLDPNGTRLLMFPWSGYYFGKAKGARTFAMFEINADMIWTRTQTTPEPISGLEQVGAPANLGSVPVAMDAWNPKVDALQVDKPTFHIVCGVPLQVDDFLDDKRVRRVVNNRGLTFADVY